MFPTQTTVMTLTLLDIYFHRSDIHWGDKRRIKHYNCTLTRTYDFWDGLIFLQRILLLCLTILPHELLFWVPFLFCSKMTHEVLWTNVYLYSKQNILQIYDRLSRPFHCQQNLVISSNLTAGQRFLLFTLSDLFFCLLISDNWNLGWFFFLLYKSEIRDRLHLDGWPNYR